MLAHMYHVCFSIMHKRLIANSYIDKIGLNSHTWQACARKEEFCRDAIFCVALYLKTTPCIVGDAKYCVSTIQSCLDSF